MNQLQISDNLGNSKNTISRTLKEIQSTQQNSKGTINTFHRGNSLNKIRIN
jgi:hypothetical protein